jgi:hypothetical protein
MEVGKWKMAQRWRHFKRPADSRGMWKQFVEDAKEPIPMAEGGVPQLVQPGQPGVRQGYATSKTPSKKFKYKITNQSGTVWSDNPPGGWEGDYLKMEKDPKFKKWLKTEEIDYDKIEGKHKGNIRKRFQTFLKYKDNIGIKELAEHTPFTHNTLREMIYNADKKIEKQMPYKTKSKIKNAKRVVAEMEKAGIVALDVGKKEWRYKTLNQKKIKALNNIAYGPRTFNPDTMDEMYRLFENEKFMDWIKKYEGGKIPDEIIETIYKKGNRGAHAFMQLGRVLQGKGELEGVLTNKKLGDRIVSAMIYDASQGKRGPMWGASYNYVKQDMNKYAGKNMTWDGLGDAIKREFKEINKSLPKNSKINNIAIDEVFPIRTGSSSIGELKGADAYSNFVQFIDHEINSTKKVTFDGQSTKRAKKIIAELKTSNPDYELVKKLSQTQDAEIKKFYKENPGTKGKVNLQRFPWDEKTKRFLNPKEVFEAQYKGRYDELPKKIRTGMEKFHAKHKLSIDPGKTFTMLEAQSKPTIIKMLKTAGYRCLKSSGGKEDVACYLRDARNQLKSIKNRQPGMGRKLARFRNFGKKALLWGLGPADIVIEGLFAQHGIASGHGKDQIWADSLLGLVIPQSLGGPKFSDEIRLDKISELGGEEYANALNQEQEFNNILDQYYGVEKIPADIRGYDTKGYKEKLYADLDKVADEYITRQEYLTVPENARSTDLDAEGNPLQPVNLGPGTKIMKWSQDLNPDSFAAQDFRTANEKLQAMEAAKGQASGVPKVKLETQEAENKRKTTSIGEHPRGEDYWVEFFRDLRGWDPAWSGPHGTGYSFKHEGMDYYKEGGRVSYLNGGIASLKKK